MLSTQREMGGGHVLAHLVDDLDGGIALTDRALATIRTSALRISTLEDWLPFQRRQDLATFTDRLRRAGLPE